MSPKTKRSTLSLAGCLTAALALAACGGSSDTGSSGASAQPGASGPVTVTYMIASTDPNDVKVHQDAVAPWEAQTGNKVKIVSATDIDQELTKGFADGTAPDLFDTDAEIFPTYAKAGNLLAYGDQLDMKGDFYPNLVQTFTYSDKFYCAPKDFTTLALVLNTDLWQQAGLGTGDVPKDWSALESVAQKLTTGSVKGLVIGDTSDRVGAFMKQAGGWIVSPDQTRMTADTATNLTGLTEVQKLLANGSASYPKGVGAETATQALGEGKAVMTIESTSIRAAMRNGYPTLKWQAVELPAGPAAKGTLAFTECYGIAAKSKNQAAAIDLVTYLSTSDPAMALATGLGVMPSIKSAAAAYKGAFPNDAAFIAGAEYAQLPVSVAGMVPVLEDFDAQVATLPKGDPKAMLEKLQQEGTAVFQ
ncbi:extracellular solute-binding protein [Humibacillus xanthopallidus]|uniref:Carbohydrate ABC transporter substrate-binding protein (CUT1 family) n=1 Tax=Humibacillus xanthopallidus TaxID=412689 RepID=A0A543HGM1_9MICO|nr:extracellular solute-binding protein [Humibacillus xanthopallidus]TQM57482.1 carbohydrate ABC transporter substrate-binding protein (CUT1 family) [Humibacillus xanthopallidus]